MEVIEIRGIRSSMAESLYVKRILGSVVDAITAEDIGKFFDRNVADSLQSVSGSSVSICGLSSGLTFTPLNGNFIITSSEDLLWSFY